MIWARCPVDGSRMAKGAELGAGSPEEEEEEGGGTEERRSSTGAEERGEVEVWETERGRVRARGAEERGGGVEWEAEEEEEVRSRMGVLAGGQVRIWMG